MKTKQLLQTFLLAAGILCAQFLNAQNPCQAGFTFSMNNNAVTFTNTSTGGNMPSYSWNFGDGNYDWQANPVHTYMYNGTYYACLTMYDSLNQLCQSTYCDTIVITNAPPVPCSASFYYVKDSSGTGNDSLIDFYDTSNPSAVNWFWNFGDGNTSTQQNPIHQYAQTGNYIACLTIIDVNGDTCMTCDTIYVAAQCHALFTHAASGANVNFTNASTGTDPNTSYYWDFGDNGTSSLANPTHNYIYNGTYWACLTIYNQNTSCYDQYCDTIVITGGQNPPCNAMWYAYPDSNMFNGTYNFVDYSTGQPVSWSWTFGDGGTSTQQNPIHTYTAQGTYTVCLTITTQSSGTCTSCDTVAYKILSGINELSNVSSLKNYPNPFSRNTTISYSLKEKADVNISVYSDMGLKAVELENSNREAGNHQIEWNAENLNSGVYFLEIKSAGNIVSRKMILIH